MINPLDLLLNVVFHPDEMDGITNDYKTDPKTMTDEDMVLEATNILDTSDYKVLAFIAEKVQGSVDYDDWMRTKTLPPMIRLWLRENLHHLRKRLV